MRRRERAGELMMDDSGGGLSLNGNVQGKKKSIGAFKFGGSSSSLSRSIPPIAVPEDVPLFLVCT